MTGQIQGAPREKVPGRSRPFRVWAIAISAVAVIMLLALAGLYTTGRLPGALLPDGPLTSSSDIKVTLPLQPQDAGAAWGNLQLRNGSPDSTIILDSVSFESMTGELRQRVVPYVWDEGKYKISGSGALDAYALPLPSEWTKVPKHRLKGYELKPASPGDQDPKIGYTGPEAEVVFEFDVPKKASGFSAVTVRYSIGRVQYSKSFDIAFTLCPPGDLKPCN